MVLLNVGPMGPRGLGPNPFSTVSPCPPGVFFSAKKASQTKIMRISKTNGVFFEICAILGNVDLNLWLTIYKIAI